MILDRKVPGIESMHLRVRQVGQVGLATFRGEEDVLLPPEDERLRLAFAKKRLPHRIEWHVRAIIVKQIQIHTRRVRPLHERDVRLPVIRAHELGPLRPVQVDRSDGVPLEKRTQWLLGLGGSTDPERTSKAIPRRREANLVRVRVLNDEPLQGVRIAADDPEPDRTSVILHVEPVSVESLQREKLLDDLGDSVERVGVRRRVGNVTVPEAGIVGRDHVKAIGQRADQIAILVGRRGKPVKQHELGTRGMTGFAVGDFQTGDVGGSVRHRHSEV